ncbi:MAG: UvrD-helicase domain-containing protein, partial [Mucinivorans sp.]
MIAGAGSGKTRTITYRIAHMIRSGVKPWNILALTFTNKAAKEMRARIEEIVPADQLRGLWMGTFHSVFRRILVREADKIGFNENFTIYETADSKNLVKSIVRELELPDDKYKPQQVFARISLAKNSLITPAAYAANETVRSEDNEAHMGEIYHIYALYCQRCKANGAMDFDDILLYMNILIRDYPDVAARYGDMFRYIMVDEYQDTNFSQYLIVKKLATIHGNVCVVGDDSQSIYSFRGARIENILKFQKDFAACRVYKLEQNYRSTRTIVEAANSLIAHNEQRLEKTLFSEQSQGDKIRVLTCFNDKQEAQSV